MKSPNSHPQPSSSSAPLRSGIFRAPSPCPWPCPWPCPCPCPIKSQKSPLIITTNVATTSQNEQRATDKKGADTGFVILEMAAKKETEKGAEQSRKY